MIRYKIIMMTIIDCFTLIEEMILIYSIIVIFAATIYMSLFGGMMQSSKEFRDKFNSLDDNDFGGLYINFNDIVSSILKIMLLTFNGIETPDIVNMAFFLRDSVLDAHLIKILTFLIFFINEKFIFELLIGIILNLTNIYTALNQRKIEREKELLNKNDLIKFALDEHKFSHNTKKIDPMEKQEKKRELEKKLMDIIDMNDEELD